MNNESKRCWILSFPSLPIFMFLCSQPWHLPSPFSPVRTPSFSPPPRPSFRPGWFMMLPSCTATSGLHSSSVDHPSAASTVTTANTANNMNRSSANTANNAAASNAGGTSKLTTGCPSLPMFHPCVGRLIGGRENNFTASGKPMPTVCPGGALLTPHTPRPLPYLKNLGLNKRLSLDFVS